MDSVSKQERGSIMRLVKSNETSLERSLRSRLWKQGIRYRKNSSSLFGKHDISNIRKKIVIFIDSCFWHGCPVHLRMPKSNIDYWVNKVEKNRKRDKDVKNHYREKNWTVLRFWEHQIKKDVHSAVEEIMKAINRKI